MTEEEILRPILLVSDDETMVTRTRNLLTHAGFEVYVTDSSEEAALFCKSRQPVAAFADIEMLRGDGFEAIVAVRKLTRDCVIIATTRGNHDLWWRVVSIVCGADEYVIGPMTRETLDDSLAAADKHAAMRKIALSKFFSR